MRIPLARFSKPKPGGNFSLSKIDPLYLSINSVSGFIAGASIVETRGDHGAGIFLKRNGAVGMLQNLSFP
jgi:hypothetical protein